MDEEKRKRVTKEEMIAEMAVVLKDKSLAKITREEEGLRIKLLNGQRFVVEVKEE